MPSLNGRVTHDHALGGFKSDTRSLADTREYVRRAPSETEGSTPAPTGGRCVTHVGTSLAHTILVTAVRLVRSNLLS